MFTLSSSTTTSNTYPSNHRTKAHHYTIDAASLLDRCRRSLRSIVPDGAVATNHHVENDDQGGGEEEEEGDDDEETYQSSTNPNILDLERTLFSTEQLLLVHISDLLERERGKERRRRGGSFSSGSSSPEQYPSRTNGTHGEPHSALMDAIDRLKEISVRKERTTHSVFATTGGGGGVNHSSSAMTDDQFDISFVSPYPSFHPGILRSSSSPPSSIPTPHHHRPTNGERRERRRHSYNIPPNTTTTTTTPLLRHRSPSLGSNNDNPRRRSSWSSTTPRTPSRPRSPTPSPPLSRSPSSSPPSSLPITTTTTTTSEETTTTTDGGVVGGCYHRQYVGESSSDGGGSLVSTSVTAASSSSSRSVVDSLLFRLIVTLQLCHVRIEEARAVLCPDVQGLHDPHLKRRRRRRQRRRSKTDRHKHDHNDNDNNDNDRERNETTKSRSKTKRKSNKKRNKNDQQVLRLEEETKRNTKTWKLVGFAASLSIATQWLLSHNHHQHSDCNDATTRSERTSTSNTTTNHIPSVVFSSSLSPTKHPSSFRILYDTIQTLTVVGPPILLLRKVWRVFCTNARLINTVMVLEDWQRQWTLVHSVGVRSSSSGGDRGCSTGSGSGSEDGEKEGLNDGLVLDGGGGGLVGNSGNYGLLEEEMDRIRSDEQCRRLLELIPLQSTKSSIVDLQSAFRSRLIRWTMDTLYASVGTALQITNPRRRTHDTTTAPSQPTLFMSVATAATTAAAASYYALVGPSLKSAQVLSSANDGDDGVASISPGRPELLHSAWGMVSLPAVKRLSLRASTLWKGAAIAERIYIGDVPCFVLSKDPCPVLAAAIRKHRRQQKRDVSNLSTIFESERVDMTQYPSKDIILHLTGGGFFAHTIAGDLPFLIDWSAKTKAVVICPEYALLPAHTFPTAINEVSLVYTSIVSGCSVHTLGFRTDRIIVTGESAGGNLGAALCVKLCMDGMVDVEGLTVKRRFQCGKDSGGIDDFEKGADNRGLKGSGGTVKHGNKSSTYPTKSCSSGIHLPDALMLCCPALNLSLELSPSRVIGTRDPVLPSPLIATISDAYIPSSLGIPKTNPIASPYYASDEILRIFPPTLLYASSEDPLLDDSVHFNARLRRLGVDSDLRAAQDMPHAYWGLGGFGLHPEAKHVQGECEEWMVRQLDR